ncbi:hypothetical protein [Vibrio quintilis]|uniref:Uncharacterized protein n=1 Tax=Vibrio quintilis TaxID=1117707 RepID=A0A1M7Z0M9_9VIBR|nr:hypothetical protein [Vibrio quintilis]SHO58414.1 hypothetical protein VQ7734_04186 [Vibrio quintilis]
MTSENSVIEGGAVLVYGFKTVGEINLPFGTLKLVMNEQKEVAGTISMTKLLGMPEKVELLFMNKIDMNGSTGYSTIKTPAIGYDYLHGEIPNITTTEVFIELKPGMKEGRIVVEGYIDLPLYLIKEEINFSDEVEA